MNKIILNPAYILKPDQGRVLFLDKESVRSDTTGDEGYNSFIHPVIAIIMNNMDGTSTLEESAMEISKIFDIEAELIINFCMKLINNEERLSLCFGGVYYIFPKNCLLLTDGGIQRQKLNYELFLCDELDLRIKRHYTPTDITIMLNTICETDCFYCYADRRIKMNCKIPFERFQEIIKEVHSFYGRSINVIGGEFFLYKRWKDLLIELKKYNFSPYISTKIPLKEEQIKDLSIINIDDIQISLDTLLNDSLMNILNVKSNYIEEIKASLLLLEKYNVKVVIHTIINSKNDTVQDLESIYNFIKRLSNIKSWRIDLAEYSLYSKNNYKYFKPNENNIKKLHEYIQNLDEFPINYDSLIPDKLSNKVLTDSEKLANFKDRTLCTANYSQLFILPDGEVTICEELYWNPNFIVGNVLNQSLLEIWNSERCKYLHIIPQEDIPNDSPCSICNDYYNCKSILQTCIRDTMKTYGEDKWYYPDINCPKAPPIENIIRV